MRFRLSSATSPKRLSIRPAWTWCTDTPHIIRVVSKSTETSLILYGCGDFLNDYEGISGHEEFRGGLTLLYLPELNRDGQLLGMDMWPMQTYRFRLRQASPDDSRWLARVLDRESRKLGSRVVLEDGRLRLYL